MVHTNIYFKPSLKPLVEFYSDEDRIYFFHRSGIAIQMEDSSKFIVNVCKLLDGKKTFDELSNYLLPMFPNETPYLEKLLSILDNEYLLEDSFYNYSESLTEYHKLRWSRNIEFFGAHCKATQNKYSYQEKLQSTKVAIFGLGGVGSNILYNLVALGVNDIKIVDFDKVELSNLNRQIIYNESDIGQLKTKVAERRIANFLPNGNFKFIDKKISCCGDIEEIIFDRDIVIIAIDQPREKIMEWFNLACVKHNISFLCGSLDSRFINYFTIVPKKTGCITCWKETRDKSNFLFQDIIQQESFVSSISPNVAIMPFISLVSGLLANEFLKLVTGIANFQFEGKLYTFDFFSSKITVSESWGKNSFCLTCSN